MKDETGKIVEKGLTACNQCKYMKEVYMSKVGVIGEDCLKSPVIKFNPINGENYLSGYKSCWQVNEGNCQMFEQKFIEQKKKNWLEKWLERK